MEKLTSAFAEMMGGTANTAPGKADTQGANDEKSQRIPNAEVQEPAPSPRSIIEAMLFVGHPGNEPLTPSTASELLRGVESSEVDKLVVELNQQYAAEGRPYYILSDGDGYRLVLRNEFADVRERFYGRVRRARLSRAAVDVLAIVAYNQPADLVDVDRLRGHPSGDILRLLVRRRLVEVQIVKEEGKRRRIYCTTDRFLRIFQLESLDDLPRQQELEPR